MNRPMLGVLIGGILGLLDGASALLTSPEVAPQIAAIVVGSTIKGILCGLLIGAYARRARSTAATVVFGLVVGLATALLVAWASALQGQSAWLEIVLPGAILGVIVGFATQKFGAAPSAVTPPT